VIDKIPCDEDIREYAEFIGMDLQQDQHLFYLAKQALTTPIPDTWYAEESFKELWCYRAFPGDKEYKFHPID